MTAEEIAKRHNAGVGHNSVSKDILKSFIERVERLAEERQTFTDDIRDVLKEAKSNGFDTKALNAIIRMRKQEPAARKAHEAIVETYMNALGMLA
jgi:uncharacterized protein (UPF0335 family)